MEWQRDGYVISTDPDRLDRAAIWRFLRTTYWAADISRAVLDRSVENALVFGLLSPQGDQAGFARVVTDRATEISSVSRPAKTMTRPVQEAHNPVKNR